METEAQSQSFVGGKLMCTRCSCNVIFLMILILTSTPYAKSDSRQRHLTDFDSNTTNTTRDDANNVTDATTNSSVGEDYENRTESALPLNTSATNYTSVNATTVSSTSSLPVVNETTYSESALMDSTNTTESLAVNETISFQISSPENTTVEYTSSAVEFTNESAFTYFESPASFSTSLLATPIPATPMPATSRGALPPIPTESSAPSPIPDFPNFPDFPGSGGVLSVNRSVPMTPSSESGGSFFWQDVELFMPPGAWPYNSTWTRLNPLKISIIELDVASLIYQSVFKIRGGGGFAGRAVYFEPSGIRFLRPIEIRLRFDPALRLPRNMTLVTCVYDPVNGTWVPKPSRRSEFDRVNLALGILYADTDSFSMYAPLVVPVSEPTVAAVDGGILPGQIALAVVLSILGAAFLLFICFDLWRRASPAPKDSRPDAPDDVPKHVGLLSTANRNPPPATQDASPYRETGAARDMAAAVAPRPLDPETTYLGSESAGDATLNPPTEIQKAKAARERAAPPPDEDEPPPPPPPPPSQGAAPRPALPPQQLSPVSAVDPDTPRLDTQFSHRIPFADGDSGQRGPSEEALLAISETPPVAVPVAVPAPAAVEAQPITPPDSDEEGFELFGGGSGGQMAAVVEDGETVGFPGAGAPIVTTPRSFYEPTSQVRAVAP
jgi:hypothetical protein